MCCAVICLGWKTYSFTHHTHTFFPSITNLILQWQEFIGRAGKFSKGKIQAGILYYAGNKCRKMWVFFWLHTISSKVKNLDISFLAQQYVVSPQCLTYFSLQSDFYLFPAGNKKVGIIIPSPTTTQYLPTYFSTQQQQKCAFLLTTILVLPFFEHIMVKSKQTEIPQFFLCPTYIYQHGVFQCGEGFWGLQRQAKS